MWEWILTLVISYGIIYVPPFWGSSSPYDVFCRDENLVQKSDYYSLPSPRKRVVLQVYESSSKEKT
jgi:hypothetical protein